MSIRGIDVSDYQPKVDWQAVARSGISFAIIKSTEGESFVCQVFAQYWEQAKANGLIRGAYHFFRPDSDPIKQAYHFLKTVKLQDGDLPPVLDIETMGTVDTKTLCDRAAQWIDVMEKETGFRPIIYTYPGFWQKLNTTRFSDYPLWIAHYTTAEQPIIPGGWKTWVFWQFTDQGQVEGISGGVDVNLFESIRRGDKGGKVEKIQTLLKNQGHDPGILDGSFGNGTETALIKFQQKKQLQADGVAGLKTWTALMGPSDSFVLPVGSIEPTPAPTPEPTPTPAPTPEPTPEPVPIPSIKLIDICKVYKGTSNQDQVLTWFQPQIPQTLLLEFSKLWRNQTTVQTIPVRLIDVCKYYRGLPNQDLALLWLQEKISPTLLSELAQKWNQQTLPPPSIKLEDVCKYYKGLPGQVKALEWLQNQIPPATLDEFVRQWRKP
ncbi:MAG: GH25 family lysozyme [Planktothrix sp.]